MPFIHWTFQNLMSRDATQQCVVCDSGILTTVMPLITAASQEAAEYNMMLMREVPSDVTMNL